MQKYRRDSGGAGRVLAGRKVALREPGLEKGPTQKEASHSMSRAAVCVREFNEDIKGLFTEFVGNINFERLSSWMIESTLKRSQ